MKPARWITLLITFVMVMALTVPAPAQDAAVPVVAQSASPSITEPSVPRLDPRVLIGEYEGAYINPSSGSSRMYATITSTAGSTVSGTFFIKHRWPDMRGNSSPIWNHDVPFIGRLEGDTLVFTAAGSVRFGLQVSVNTLEGQVSGGDVYTSQISLRKVK